MQFNHRLEDIVKSFSFSILILDTEFFLTFNLKG